MMIYIILGIIVYLFIGFFTVGFLDIDLLDDLDRGVFWVTALLWPLLYAALLVVSVFAIPVRFGRRVGNRFRDRVLEYLMDLICEKQEVSTDDT